MCGRSCDNWGRRRLGHMAVKPTSRELSEARPPKRKPAGSTSAVEAILRTQAREASVPERVNALVSMQVAPERGWTARLNGGVEVSKGLTEEADVRIFTDPETLAGVVGGSESGIKAFLDGRLLVRGNLALALRFDSIFKPTDRPVRWPKWNKVLAAGRQTAYPTPKNRNSLSTFGAASRTPGIVRPPRTMVMTPTTSATDPSIPTKIRNAR